jgi:hypothetical protein
LVFPRLRQFLALQFSCPTNFCKETNFLLIQLLTKLKNFGWSCFFFAQAPILFPADGRAAGRAARRAAARPLRLAMVASSRLSTAPTTAPTPSCSMDPAPSPSWSGCRMKLSLSATSRPAQKQTLHMAVCDAAANARQARRQFRCHRLSLVFRPAGFYTFFFLGAAR